MPLGRVVELGFVNQDGLLVLTVPWGMATWLHEKLGDALVLGPEAALSLEGTVRVWVQPRAEMRETSSLGALGKTEMVSRWQ